MNRLRVVGLTLFSTLFGVSLFASPQTQPARNEAEPATNFGTVTGHVYFSGANTPARLVQIALQPLQVQEQPTFQPGKKLALSFTIYQTGLDGSYVIPRVAPGYYYVVVTEPGFLSPFAQFTPAQLAHPTPEVAKLIAATLPVVGVRPNATSTLDVQLQRGAGISGTVRFDDGTPFVATRVNVQRHTAEGKWESINSFSSSPVADADGHWQVSGLLMGEYRLRVDLSVNERKQSALVGNSSASTSLDLYALSFYSGDTARERDGKSFKLEENEQRAGEDLTIPVSKLHAVSGAVVDAANGRALNAGHVELMYADDGKHAANTAIDPESRTFTFNFVPEGMYKLVVKDAREVRFVPPPPEEYDSNFPDRNRKEIAVRAYLPAEVPLLLQGEVSGLNLPVTAKDAAPQ